MTDRLRLSAWRGLLLGIALLLAATLVSWVRLDAQRWQDFVAGAAPRLYLNGPRWLAPYTAWQCRDARWSRRVVDVPATGERLSITSATIGGHAVVFTTIY